MAEFPAGGYVTPEELETALAEQPAPPGGVTAVRSPLGAPLSLFGGLNDDERLATYDAARRDPNRPVHGYPVLLDQPRVYEWRAPLLIDDGFCVVGAVRPQDQPRGSKPIATQVNLRTDQGWLELPDGETFGVCLEGLSIDASSKARVFEPNENAVLWTSQLRDISYQNGPGVLGSSAIAQACDVVTIEGFCNWNNIRDRAYHWRGSDNGVVCTKFLIDSPPSFMGPKGYLVQYSSLSKTDTVGWYMTAEQHSAVLLEHSNNDAKFARCFIEGRNANTPCYGALIRASCSFSQWMQCWIAYGMSDPAAGPAPDDAGLFHATEGTHELLHCHTKRANGADVDTPFAYGTGPDTHLIVRGIVSEQGDGRRPIVKVENGATADVDSSVELVAA